MTRVFDTLLLPFRGSPPLCGFLFLSGVFGIIMILIFKHTSNQKTIGAVRRRMGARALGMLLHLHSPAAVIKTAAALMGDNFVYLWMILRPMLVIAVPFILTAAQLDARYGRVPVKAEDTATVTITWNALPEREGFNPTGTGLDALDPVVFVDTLRQTSFNIAHLTPGASLTVDGTTFPVGAAGSGSGAVVYRGAAPRGLLERLIEPFLAGIPGESTITEVSIQLPEARYRILGGRWSWLAVFLVFSSITAIAGTVAFKVKV